MTAPFIEHLASEIAGLKQSGLYKAERVITSPQAGTITVADIADELLTGTIATVSTHPRKIASRVVQRRVAAQPTMY